jgi:hypothetical protein
MALKDQLVKFGYGEAVKASTAAGHISFATDTRQIFVGDGENAVAYAGNVKNATFANQKLTITYNNGDADAVLDFSDVASAEGVNSLLATLRTSINANARAIENIDASYKAGDTSVLNAAKKYADDKDASVRADFAKADASLNERLQVIETAVGDGGNVDTRIEAAVNALDSSVEDADVSNFVTVKVEQTAGKLTGLTVSTTDVASASVLADVKAIAEAAATAEAFNTYKTSNDSSVSANRTAIGEVSTSLNNHINNTTVHITAQERTDWNQAKSDIDAFMTLAEGETLNGALDSLKELQDFITSEADAADKLVKDLSDVSTRAEKGISDAAAAQSTANEALALGNAAATQADFNTYKESNNAEVAKKADKTQVASDIAAAEGRAAQDASNKANAAETAAKAYADAIKVNGKEQSGQNITISGADISVGGTDSAYAGQSISFAIKSLEDGVSEAKAAGVQTLDVENGNPYVTLKNGNNKGAVTLVVKKVALADASESNTGLADAYDVKTSIAAAKSEVVGASGDASTANTVYGAKKYAADAIDAAQLRWNAL